MPNKASNPYNYYVVHYSEIGLKGDNRAFFERKLVENIRLALPALSYLKVQRVPGRIYIQLAPTANHKLIESSLKNVFGISHFSPAVSCTLDLAKIEAAVWQLTKDFKNTSFRINTKRSTKNFKLDSLQLNTKLGSFLLAKTPSLKVDLSRAKLQVNLEIINKDCFIYLQKIKGPGGMPVSSEGKVLALLSAGFDSPVASYLMLKRGAKVSFVHFNAYPFTTTESIDDCRALAQKLNVFQYHSEIFFVPFAKIQEHIAKLAPPRFRVILYRRAMLKIASVIAWHHKCKALVTGESLGQVASQTLENLYVTNAVTTALILRPLISFDKEEIINLAKKIDTHDISAHNAPDCCTLFTPKHPVTNAQLKDVLEIEKSLGLSTLIKETVHATTRELV